MIYIQDLKEKTSFIDKILILNISLIPLSLAISIFFADFLASLTGIILICLFFFKKNLEIFRTIKKEIFFFLFFYLIILISFTLTNFKNESFLASFFYFRYFLLSLSIFYLLKKYTFFLKIICYSVYVSIAIVLFDSLIQYFFGVNLIGYERVGAFDSPDMLYLTGFFNDEKKLGSYLVRFLPLLLSLIYFTKNKISVAYELIILSFLAFVIFLSSERTALFLLFLIFLFYFLMFNKKFYFLLFIISLWGTLFYTFSETRLVKKYVNFTLQQIGIDFLISKNENQNKLIRYYSEEHENLTYTGLIIFKENYFFGSGVKTFYQKCDKLKKDKIIKSNKRNNKLVCSTHAHNTYIQILSEVGFFGFLLIIFLFIKVFYKNLIMIFKKKKDNLDKAYFFINLSLIINLWPLIPSGSFFNNWMCLMMFFPLGFWLYIKDYSK